MSIAEHPWTVFLLTPSGFQYCGGTLVAPSSVVTAAHCVARTEPGGVFVVAGREDKTSDAGVAVGVTGVWLHPEFDPATYRNDLAVLALERPVPYSALPVATEADRELSTPGTPAGILGWGTTDSGGSSPYLLGATVPMADDGECARAYGVRYDPAVMVCAGFPEGGADTCQGDSGGPLVVGGRLVGITSFGIGCGAPGNPGVYTRVAAFADTIAEQVRRPTATAPRSFDTDRGGALGRSGRQTR